MARKIIEVLARGVCVVKGRVLLCHTKGASNTYLPGGHVEFRESAPDALAREIHEEMGIVACVGDFLGVVEHSFVQETRRHCEVNLVFAMTLSGVNTNRRVRSREDYIEFVWFPLKKLRKSNFEPSSLRDCLCDWLESGRTGDGWSSTYPRKSLKRLSD